MHRMHESKPTEDFEMNDRQDEQEDDSLDEMGRRGHILWIRGLTRLQTQVSGGYALRPSGILSFRSQSATFHPRFAVDMWSVL